MNKAFGSHFNDFGGSLEKIICSSLPARLMEEFLPSKVPAACNPTYWKVSQQTYG